jgi:argininosuccinate lyase
MQEDKVPVFDTAETLRACLSVLQEMMPEVKFNTARLRDTAGGGYSTATDIAEYLVRKGMPFRAAHEITGRLVLSCIAKNIPLTALSPAELRSFSPMLSGDVLAILDPAASVKTRSSFGGTSPSEVKRQLRHYRKLLK